MKILNKNNLPDIIVKAIESLIYAPKAGNDSIGVTSLIAPPIIHQLRKRHWDEIKEDVIDSTWRLFGSAIHKVMEDVSDSKIAEQWASKEINGITVKCKADVKDGSELFEYKCTCLPLEAEILTKDGFKKYDEIKVGEEVLAYDIKKDQTTWVPLLKISVFPLMEVITLKSKSFQMRCTPNHKWFVEAISEYKGKKYIKRKVIEARNFKSGKTRIITSACCVEKGTLDITPEESALLGWIVTDGGIAWIGNSPSVYISQSKEPYRSEIREKFKNWFTSEKIRTIGWSNKPISIFHVKAKEIRKLFNKLGFKNKNDLPSIVTRLSVGARQAMLDAMKKAEGTTSKKGHFYWAQNPGGVFDSFQILATLEGQRLGLTFNNKGTLYTSFSSRRYVSTYNRKTGKPIFDKGLTSFDPVWCPTTKYGSFVTRFNRQVTITGNSVWHKVLSPNELPPEWARQLNVNAYLFGGIKTAKAIVIYRDWSKSKALKEADYPQAPLVAYDIKLAPEEDQLKYILERVKLHKEAVGLSDDQLPICSPEDRWAKETTWAVYKNTNKTALRVHKSKGLAEKMVADLTEQTKDSYKIEERKGADVKCEGFCPVAKWCSYGKQLIEKEVK